MRIRRVSHFSAHHDARVNVTIGQLRPAAEVNRKRRQTTASNASIKMTHLVHQELLFRGKVHPIEARRGDRGRRHPEVHLFCARAPHLPTTRSKKRVLKMSKNPFHQQNCFSKSKNSMDSRAVTIVNRARARTARQRAGAGQSFFAHAPWR